MISIKQNYSIKQKYSIKQTISVERDVIMQISDFDLHADVDGELAAGECVTVAKEILASEELSNYIHEH